MGEKKIKQGATLFGNSHHLQPEVFRSKVRQAIAIVSVANVCVKREGKSPVYLLSDHVWIMACLNLEGAVVCPEVNRSSNASDPSLEDLKIFSRAPAARQQAIPFQQPRCQQSRIRDRHISSSIQTIEGTWRGNGRRHLVRLRLPGGWSCDLSRLRGSLRRERASPSSRSCRYSRAVGTQG